MQTWQGINEASATESWSLFLEWPQKHHLALSSKSKIVGTRSRGPLYELFLEVFRSHDMRLVQPVTGFRISSKLRLAGWWNSDVLRLGIVGMRGCIVIRLRPRITWVPLPPYLPVGAISRSFSCSVNGDRNISFWPTWPGIPEAF